MTASLPIQKLYLEMRVENDYPSPAISKLCPKVVELELVGVSDVYLGTLPHLTSLTLRKCCLTEEEVMLFLFVMCNFFFQDFSKLPKLTHLSLLEHDGIDEDIESRATYLTGIKSASFSHHSQDFYGALEHLPALEEFDLGMDQIGRGMFEDLKEYAPNLKRFRCGANLDFEQCMKLQTTYYGKGTMRWFLKKNEDDPAEGGQWIFEWKWGDLRSPHILLALSAKEVGENQKNKVLRKILLMTQR